MLRMSLSKFVHALIHHAVVSMHHTVVALGMVRELNVLRHIVVLSTCPR